MKKRRTKLTQRARRALALETVKRMRRRAAAKIKGFDEHVEQYQWAQQAFNDRSNGAFESYPNGFIVELPWYQFWSTHASTLHEKGLDDSVPDFDWHDDAFFARVMDSMRNLCRSRGRHPDSLRLVPNVVGELRRHLDEPIIAVGQKRKSFDWFRRNAHLRPYGRGRRGGPPQGGRGTGLNSGPSLPVFETRSILFVLPDEISATLFTLRWS